VVRARHVEPGESVAPGQPLLGLYAPDAMRVEVQLPQSEAQAVRQAATVTVVLADGQRVVATKVTVFPAADPTSHALGVRMLLPVLQRPPQPGTTAQVLFPSATAALLRLPRSVIAQRGELSGVYVLDDGRLTLRQLRLGTRQGDQVEVLAGLAANEVIVTNPVAALQALQAQRGAVRAVND
jgi:HlyD family secretion protein